MENAGVDLPQEQYGNQHDQGHLTKEVYAHFGLAYYFAECVYRGLVHVVATAGEGLTRPRVEERFKALEQKTLGALIVDAKPIVPVELHSSLEWALERRNFLAHGFWFERIHLVMDREGIRFLIEELTIDTDKFRALSRALDAIALPKLGLTPDKLASLLEQSQHEPPDPLPTRQIPKLGSKLDLRSAWQFPLSTGYALVFQDLQGSFWQLCDVGLGWSYVEGPKHDWVPCEVVNKYLPAKVLARPKDAQSWNYSLEFTTGPRLVVWWDDQQDCFRWKMAGQGGKPG